MTRRVGLARWEALVEGLKRSLAESGTTFTGATLKDGTVDGSTLSNDHTITGTGLVGTNRSDETSLIRTGAGIMGAMEVELPAGAMIVDVGVVVTDDIGLDGSSNVSVRVGTSADGTDICAAANLISSADEEAAGSVMNVIGASGESGTSLTFVSGDGVDQGILWSSSARSIHITMRNGDAEDTTQGKAYGFVRFCIMA